MKEKKQNDLIDIEKLVMALMVAAIHIVPLSEYNKILYPWLRIAVPFFFVCSSYFLFYKIRQCGNGIEEKKVIKHFVLRNFMLYLSWSIVLFPLIIFMNRNIKGGELFVKILKSFFFSGLFGGSWYILALIEGVCIVYFVSHRKNLQVVTWIIGGVCYLLTISSTNYSELLNSRFIEVMQNNSIVPVYLSVIAGIPWIIIGYAISALYTDNISNAKLIIGVVFGAILLLFEHLLLNPIRSTINDGYLMLLLIVSSLFLIGIRSNCHFKYARICRELSTVIFCLHHTLNRALEFIFYRVDHFIFKDVLGGLLRYAIVIIASYFTLKLLRTLSKKFSFVKFMI